MRLIPLRVNEIGICFHCVLGKSLHVNQFDIKLRVLFDELFEEP
jgi:hypothetical protein